MHPKMPRFPTSGALSPQRSRSLPSGPPACVQRKAVVPRAACAACGGCHSVRYCSEACGRAHWRVHRVECRRLQAAA